MKNASEMSDEELMAIVNSGQPEVPTLSRASSMSDEELQKIAAQPTQDNFEKQNAIGATFNVPGAAIRSALQGKGYMEGALNPSKVEKFQDIAIRKAQISTNPVVNAILGMPASALGMAADIVTSPADVLMMGATALKPVQAVGQAVIASKAGQAVVGAVTKEITPIRWVKDAFFGTKKAQQAAMEAKKSVTDIVSQEVSKIRSEGSAQKAVVSRLAVKQGQALDNEANSLANALDSAEKTYKGVIADESFSKSQEVRKALPQLFKEKSKEYGDGLGEILSAKPVMVSREEVLPVLEQSLMDHGIVGIDEGGAFVIKRSGVTRAENQIINEYARVKAMSPTAEINTGDLLQAQRLLSPKRGKVWGTSEHLQSQVSEGLSAIVAQKSPEVAAYRKAYAPFLEWKKAVIKEFQPFAGKYANKKGSQILSKYADVNKVLTQDEVKLVSELEKQLQTDITSQLKSTRGIGREISSRKNNLSIQGKVRGQELKDAVAAKKSAIDDVISARVRSLEDQKNLDISKIDEETKQIIDGLRRRKIIIGATAALTAGPSFFKYIKNRLSYGIFGITGN
jgi:hypothetical protein